MMSFVVLNLPHGGLKCQSVGMSWMGSRLSTPGPTKWSNE